MLKACPVAHLLAKSGLARPSGPADARQPAWPGLVWHWQGGAATATGSHSLVKPWPGQATDRPGQAWAVIYRKIISVPEYYTVQLVRLRVGIDSNRRLLAEQASRMFKMDRA
jgi:hypothetical protein